MSISVNPIFPVISAQGVAPDVALQPGSVVDAQVLKLLSEELVQIAISGLSIEVLSEVPLSAGQSLQLAVSQTESGIRLAIVPPQAHASAAASADTVTLAPDAIVRAGASPLLAATPPRDPLTPLERLAVTAAAQKAATQQESLAPLFANIEALGLSNGLPLKLQQALVQVLAQRTSLDQNLDGSAIKTGVQKSGLFFEASLASTSALPASGVPDLKAALIVLRQTILSSLGTTGTGAPAANIAQPAVGPGLDVSAHDASPLNPRSPLEGEGAPIAPSLAPEPETREILLPQARIAVAEDAAELNGSIWIAAAEGLPNAGPRIVGAALDLLQEQEAFQANSDPVANPLLATATAKGEGSHEVTFHTNTPPPPFRGALPSAQPIASPSLAPDAPLATKAHHLLGETDAALARQTLLQVASLPDRADAAARIDPSVARWNFEIPFATQQGTAIAQFEISRDGAGTEIEAAKRVWRARFSLDVEPAGPVHALVSLNGGRTSVRLWAERPLTAAKLRAGAAQLSHALSRAELLPGDIVIRNGAPPQPVPARAGHFLDRAL